MKELSKNTEANATKKGSAEKQMPTARRERAANPVVEKTTACSPTRFVDDILPIAREVERVTVSKRSTEILRMRGNKWGVYNSSLLDGEFSFQKSFEELLPEGENLKEYLENRFSARNGDVVGLEVGGSGSNIFNEFSDGFFAQSAGISLSDERDNQLRQSDRERNHRLIVGDLLETGTKQRVLDWLQGRKVDILFERMYCGLDALPDAPFYLAEQVGFYYSLLSEDGVLFAEVPDAFTGAYSYRDLINPWAQKMRETCPSLDIQTGDNGLLVRIQKQAGSPDELPLLTAREVISAARAGMRLHQEQIAKYLTE